MAETPPIYQGKDLHRKAIAIYCRISQDDEERGEGVAKQEKWGRDYAAKTWPGMTVEVFCDNNLTAADPNVFRPDFHRLREWIKDGKVAQIWCVEQFRLIRMPEEWFPFARELTAAGIDQIHTRRDGIVIVQSEAAGINAVLGGGEVRRTKTRIHDTLEENALQGKPPGSRPAGYRHARVKGLDTYEIVEEEWRPRLWAAKAVLDGWSVESAAAELRKQGVQGSHRRIIRDEDKKPVIDPETGEPAFRITELTAAALRKWLVSPAVAGLRVHKGEIVGRGNWPPLLCDDPYAEGAYETALAVRDRILARLGRPREVTTKSGKTYKVTAHVLAKSGRARRRYYLTGGAFVCAECKHAIVGGMKQMGKGEKKTTRPYFWCTTSKGGGGCVGMLAEEVERIFRKQLLEHVSNEEFAARFGSDPHIERREAIVAELDAMETKRGVLAAQWASDDIGDAEWKAARERLDEREGAIRDELALIPEAPPKDFDPRVLRDPRVWDAMTVGERRFVVEMLVEKVELAKAKPPYSKIDDSRVTITWK